MSALFLGADRQRLALLGRGRKWLLLLPLVRVLPGGWGGGETGGLFRTLSICEGVLCLGAVCVFALQAVGCLCSNRGQFPSMWLCSSAALGSAPLAAGLGPPGALSIACTFWKGAGMQTAGALLIALAPGARGAEVPESRDQVTGDQLWAGLAGGPRIQGSERGWRVLPAAGV